MEPRLHPLLSPSYNASKFLVSLRTKREVFDVSQLIGNLSEQDRLFARDYLVRFTDRIYTSKNSLTMHDF